MAEKVTLKWNPPKPERESKRKKQKKGLQADFIDISRGNAFLFLGGRVSKTKKKPIVKPKKEVAAAVAQKSPKTPKKVAKGGIWGVYEMFGKYIGCMWGVRVVYGVYGVYWMNGVYRGCMGA